MDSLLDFVLQLYRLAHQTPVDEFQDLAFKMLKAVVPFRTATWSHAELTHTNLKFSRAHLHDEPPEMLAEFTSLNRNHPTALRTALRNPGKSQSFHSRDVYRAPADRPILDYTRRYGHDRVLMATDLHGTEWISCYRPENDVDFVGRDTAILDALMPHLVEALAINRSLTLGAGSTPDAPHRTGTRALMRHNGVLLHCGDGFLDLLRLQWPDWSEPRLPDELLSSLLSAPEARIAGDTVHITAQSIGDAQLLTATRVSPLERLSPRELVVSREFGSGKSYKTIARELQLAPATVRNMLQSAYRKLGIDNKAALARLIDPRLPAWPEPGRGRSNAECG